MSANQFVVACVIFVFIFISVFVCLFESFGVYFSYLKIHNKYSP
jgi:hypothetical protein